MPSPRLFAFSSLVIGWLSLSSVVVGAESPVFVKAIVEAKSVVTGYLGRENDTHIEIIDFEKDAPKTYKKSELRSLRKDASASEIAQTIGVARIAAWQLKKAIPSSADGGTIVKLDSGIIYLSVGTSHGIEPGVELKVFRGSTPLTDPTTGKVLGVERRLVGKLKVTEAREAFSKARLADELEVELKVGDTVESATGNSGVAVMPLTDEGDEPVVAGRELAEAVTSILAKKDVVVVERTMVAKVLAELLVQNLAIFDPNNAKALGKQMGARYIVVGRILDKRSWHEYHLRLVEVQTGRILDAFQYKVFPNKEVNPIDLSPAPIGSIELPGPSPPASAPDAIGPAIQSPLPPASGKWTRVSAIEASTSANYSPDGKRLVLGTHGAHIFLYDSDSGQQTGKIQLRPGGTESYTPCFSRDGSKIAVALVRSRQVDLWDSKSNQKIRSFSGHRDEVSSVSFSWDGKKLISGCRDRTVRVWDVETGAQLQEYASGPDAVAAFNSTGKLIAFAGPTAGEIIVFDAASQKQLSTIRKHTGGIGSLVFLKSGDLLLSGSADGTARIFQSRTGEERAVYQHQAPVTRAAVSSDGSLIATCGNDRVVRIWDANGKRELQQLQGHSDTVFWAAFRPDGRQLVSSSHKETILWARK